MSESLDWYRFQRIFVLITKRCLDGIKILTFKTIQNEQSRTHRINRKRR